MRFGPRAPRRSCRSASSSLTWLVALAVIVPALQHAEPFGEEGFDVTLWTWIPAGGFNVDIGFHVDALTAVPADRRDHDRHARARLLDRVHGPRPGTWRFFAYLNLFMFSMLLLVLANSWLLVFAGWELVGLSSYSLIGFWYTQALRGAGREEGVHRQPRRRRRVRARDHGDLREHRHAEHPGVDRQARPGRRPANVVPIGDRRAARVRRRDGQERPVPAPRLAARRDGGPDAGLGPDPRGDDGQRRRLPRRPRQPAVRAAPRRRWSSSPRSASSPRSSRPRSRSPRPTSSACSRTRRCQPAGLHVRRARRRGVHRRDLPPHDPRLLQGPAVPRLRLGDPRGPRGAGHEPHGRPVAEDPDHPLDDADRRRSRSPGIPPLAGFFSKDEILGEAFKHGFYWVWAIGARSSP